ncbi:MAG: Mur ligase domain-containing protein [Planctomycetota bacterium]
MAPHRPEPARPDPAAEQPWIVAGRRIHMVGIGGCGMSALARMLLARGADLSGSDAFQTEITGGLQALGVRVFEDQTGAALPEGVEFVVHTAAVKADHAELIAAADAGAEVLSYAEALGRCMHGYTGLAIAGTHGKSTTTAMLGCAMTDAGLDPTVIVGATCSQLARGALAEPARDSSGGTGFRLGPPQIPAGPRRCEPGLLLAEACEFNRSFHHFRPKIASIGSVEADHLDIYGSLDAVVEAFREFAALLPPSEHGGLLLIAHDGAHRRAVTAGLRCRVETIGLSPEADWVFGISGKRVTLARRGEAPMASFTSPMPGVHNATNAATALALAVIGGADPEIAARSLEAFRGLDRRLQLLGERPVDGGAVRVWDDYGHHPTEIDATLRALREHEKPQDRGGRLICVFQPHQHSRTRFLLDEFAQAFGEADAVIVPHIYFVRDSEAEKQRVSASDLVDRLRQRGVRAMHLYPFGAIVEQLENLCRAGDTLVVMGAGPVWQVGRNYLESAHDHASSGAAEGAR